MFTILFVILKIIGILHISWWWVILTLLIDEEMSIGAVLSRRKEKASYIYQSIDERYQDNFSEEDIEEIIEEHGDDVDEDVITQELEKKR